MSHDVKCLEQNLAQSKRHHFCAQDATTERKRSPYGILQASTFDICTRHLQPRKPSLYLEQSFWLLPPLPATKGTGRNNHSHHDGQIQFCGT